MKYKLRYAELTTDIHQSKKYNMRKFTVGQKVYWNDPAGETSGEYTVLDPLDERNKDYTEEDIKDYDDRIILIGNGISEAEVNAQELLYLSENTTIVMQDISTKFLEFCNECGHEPEYANCQIEWLDDHNQYDVTIKLSCDMDEEEDDNIFYYCNSLKELESLTETGHEDFIVTEIYSFESKI